MIIRCSVSCVRRTAAGTGFGSVISPGSGSGSGDVNCKCGQPEVTRRRGKVNKTKRKRKRKMTKKSSGLKNFLNLVKSKVKSKVKSMQSKLSRSSDLTRIIGGTPVQEGSVPWQASLAVSGDHRVMSQ